MSQAQHRDPSFGRYLAEIRKRPILSRAQEVAIARAAEQSGNREELNELIESNLLFVARIAFEHRNMGLPLGDLLSEGSLGLIEAAHRFDHTRGMKFITYAVWWIRKNILAALHDQTSVVHIPRYRKKKVSRIHETAELLSRELGRRPDREEISARLACAQSEVEMMLMFKPTEISLECDIGSEGETIRRNFAALDSPDPEKELLGKERKDLLRLALRSLSDQERTIIIQRFGLHDGRSFTLKEIGDRMGLTRERIRQIEVNAKKKLQWFIECFSSMARTPESANVRIPPRVARSIRRKREQRGESWSGRSSL